MPDRDARSFEIVRENIRCYRADAPLMNVLVAADAYDPASASRPRAGERRLTQVWNMVNRRRRWG
jgi:hypothetical protein